MFNCINVLQTQGSLYFAQLSLGGTKSIIVLKANSTFSDYPHLKPLQMSSIHMIVALIVVHCCLQNFFQVPKLNDLFSYIRGKKTTNPIIATVNII